MTTSNHLFAGAVIALTIKQPLLAAPLALMSHFVLDALPHYGHGGPGYGGLFKFKLTYLIEAFNLVGIPLLIYLLWGQSIWVFAAALLALSPDFVWVYRYFWYERYGSLPPGSRFTRFHHRIQWERPWGITVELLALVGLVALTSWLVA